MSWDDDRDQSDFLTVQQAARQLGYSDRRVRQLLNEGRLQGHKVDLGRKWLIAREQIGRLSHTRHGPTEPGTDQQRGDNLHQEELQSLLSKWLEYEEEATLESWLNIVTDYFLSPAGLLTWAQSILPVLTRKAAVEPPPSSIQFARESLLEDFAPQRAWPAPPGLIQSPLMPSLRQHLPGDVLWEQWTSANEAQARLAAHVWPGAGCLFCFTAGLLTAVPIDTQQAIGKIQLLIEDPSYRDAVSQFLKPAVYLLGADLIRRGLLDSELFYNANVAINSLSPEVLF